ncbi:diaminohydroxyphosphoribosylaminopyrimidine deaminase [Klebsormidium nitens]|uniref:Riboflavin biosynthesis protein PYRD, chloroplastic n=1 Tax=Klebsormidium nitens TaxID=105231 RepID=A0A1Y1I4X6_KLENI|nr:diaminohydroxyphosphoribosylaminopyrimidine deaminase [Klebsormidium nitens]|eukprot:GAQ83777.1 diaminohydroxyphosphoribosylaminopyrimidine deaminase [Klebsormidium nitens]
MDEITDEMRAIQPPGTKDTDIRYMRRALRLAVMARGYTSPNPMVGCVIVKNGTVVGEGWHPKAGEPHAEVFALADARSEAQGATAYVTLEPCNHYGRTPPCTEALIRAKVKKVVVGCVDQNPLVGGKGIERLREEGIEVLVGVENYACKELNIPFFYRTKYKKPYQMLRYALSLNGRSHAEMVDSATREHLHMFLADYDATIVSWKSLPLSGWDLQCMIEGTNQPVRVVVGKSWGADDSLAWLTDEVTNHPVWNTANAPLILALWHNKTSPQLQKLESMGVEVRRFAPGIHVQDAVIPILYDMGCCSTVWLGNPCEDVIEVQQIYAYAVPYYNLEGGLPAPQFTYTNGTPSENHKDGWHFLSNTQLFLTPSSACLRGSSPGLL